MLVKCQSMNLNCVTTRDPTRAAGPVTTGIWLRLSMTDHSFESKQLAEVPYAPLEQRDESHTLQVRARAQRQQGNTRSPASVPGHRRTGATWGRPNERPRIH
jgi:hypothetical protein